MGYREAIEATGCQVREYKEFGSYQGTWICVLETNELIEGSYGSCSGCDAFEAEFCYGFEPYESGGKYYNGSYEEITSEEFQDAQNQYQQKLADFGARYTGDAETLDHMISRYEIKCQGEYVWHDDQEILEWLKSIK